MGQQLYAAGEQVALTAILDHAPFNSSYRTPRLGLALVAHVLRQIAQRMRLFAQLDRDQRAVHLRKHWRAWCEGILNLVRRGSRPFGEADAAHWQQRDRFDRFLQQHYRALSSFAPQEQLRLRRVLEAEYRALTTYVPHEYPGALTVFRTQGQPIFASGDPSMGWAGLCRGKVDIRVVPGLHAYMLKEPFVRALAGELRECLDTSSQPIQYR
jgi:thioesterase domain-containing protein